MLNLTPTQSALSTFHARFLDDDMPSELSAAAFERFEPARYDAEALARGRTAWSLRTVDEYRSQVAFTELLFELTQIGFAFDILGTAVRVVRDEARHVELCKRMVLALGGSPRIEGRVGGRIGPTAAHLRAGRQAPARSRILHTIVGSLCIGETVSVRVLAAVRDSTEDPLARAVIGCLTADESIHARFGWTLLGLLLPHITSAERADIEESLPRYLGNAAAAVAGSAGSPAGGEAPLALAPANPFGSLAAAARRDVLATALELDVFGRFAELGVDARGAWERRPQS
jgi:hypothetical protein